jgi:hypothetical protein
MATNYVIYKDTSFIVELYESAKGVAVPIRVVKRANVSGGVSGGFVSAGSTMEEEKEFSIPSRQMYQELRPELEKFPLLNLDTTHNQELPELFWVEGVFGGGRPSISDGANTIASTDLFQFYTSIGNVTRLMPLVTNDAYFVSGYDQVAKHGWALTCGFSIQARILIRLLCVYEHIPIGAPMVIIKTSNDTTPLMRK